MGQKRAFAEKECGKGFNEKMQQNKTNLEEEWNISGSEDEADPQSASKTGSRPSETDLKKRKKKDKNGDSSQPIPKSIALLYKEIEKNGWIELTCKCPRKGPTKKDSQSQSSQSSTGSMTNRLENAHIAAGQSPLKPKSRPEYGFDYKEEEERPAFVPKVSSAKKTPISAKRAKKIASMANVVNDLIRHKMLDELESVSTDKTKPEDKETRVTVDFDSQESMPDMKEGIASQISRVETLLDSKETKKVKGKEK
eukprot:Seg1693.13 transcript_id=Seg1693.13/GoldUCD/mRNA.D3Y31 product="hypothetical protein" protein_id=Seg1693.13/GoldUCD/D3Y31